MVILVKNEQECMHTFQQPALLHLARWNQRLDGILPMRSTWIVSLALHVQ